MSISRVQAPTSGTTLSTALAAAWASSPVVGNLLLDLIAIDKSSGVTSASTPAGFTALTLSPANDLTNSTRHIGLYPFWKVAAGGDANPSSTVPTSSGAACQYEEWSGLAASPFDAVGSVAQLNAASGTVTPSVLASQAGDLIITLVAGNSGVSPTVGFGGGSVTDVAVQLFNASLFWAIGSQIAASAGTISPVVTVSGISGTGLPMICAVSIAFKAATVPSGSIRTANTGAGMAVSTVAANTGSGLTAATPKANVAGVLT